MQIQNKTPLLLTDTRLDPQWGHIWHWWLTSDRYGDTARRWAIVSAAAVTSVDAKVGEFDVWDVEHTPLVCDGRLAGQDAILFWPRVVKPHLLVTPKTRHILVYNNKNIVHKLTSRMEEFMPVFNWQKSEGQYANMELKVKNDRSNWIYFYNIMWEVGLEMNSEDVYKRLHFTLGSSWNCRFNLKKTVTF